MSTQSSPGRRRYSLLRAMGAAMFTVYLASAVLVVLVGVLSMVMSIGSPSWLSVIVIVGVLFVGAVCVIIGLTIKKLSAAMSDAGSNLEQIRTGLYQKASGVNR